MQKYVNFILLSRAAYIFSSFFSGCNHARLEMFCIIKSYCGVAYPPKIFLIKLTKSHFSFFIVRTSFELIWLWNILLLYVKQLNGYLVLHFSGVVFTPLKPFWAHKKKYLPLSVSNTTTYMWDWIKSEGAPIYCSLSVANCTGKSMCCRIRLPGVIYLTPNLVYKILC